MKDRISASLDDVIGKEIEGVKYLEPGTEQKAKAIDNLKNLYMLRIEEAKLEHERRERIDEMDVKHAQLKSQSVDRWLNMGLQIGLTLGGWLMYDIWNRRGFKFEETGTVRSPWTRNLISRMLPKK